MVCTIVNLDSINHKFDIAEKGRAERGGREGNPELPRNQTFEDPPVLTCHPK
jgi:hypothetical protein